MDYLDNISVLDDLEHIDLDIEDPDIVDTDLDIDMNIDFSTDETDENDNEPPKRQKRNRTKVNEIVEKTEKEPTFLDTLVAEADWMAIGQRLMGYRLVRGWTLEDLANRLENLTPFMISSIEQGKQRRTNNHIWEIVRHENLSIKWLFLGEGEYNSEDPPEFLPDTIIQERGVGIRRAKHRRDAEEGVFSGDPLEFIMAVDKYKSANRKAFVSWTEAFDLIVQLGYRKVAPPTINPMK